MRIKSARPTQTIISSFLSSEHIRGTLGTLMLFTNGLDRTLVFGLQQPHIKVTQITKVWRTTLLPPLDKIMSMMTQANMLSIYLLTVGWLQEDKVSYAECVQTVCLGLNKNTLSVPPQRRDRVPSSLPHWGRFFCMYNLKAKR